MKKYPLILALTTVLTACAYPQQQVQAPIGLPDLAADRTRDLCAIQLKYDMNSKKYKSCYEKNYPSIYETVSRNFFSAQQMQSQQQLLQIQAIQSIPQPAPLSMPMIGQPTQRTHCYGYGGNIDCSTQ